MYTAMNIGVLVPVIMHYCLNHALRLLRCRGIVQIHKRVSVDWLAQNREVGANLFDIEAWRDRLDSRIGRRGRQCGMHAHPTSCMFLPRASSPHPFSNEDA